MLKDHKDKVSYCIGIDVANNLKNQSIEVSPDALARGVADALSGGELLLTEKEMFDTMTAFRQEMQAKQASVAKDREDKRKTEGEKFLAQNSRKEGVTVLPSGLQYKVIVEGNGAMPKARDTVSVHYRGSLIDGTEFDSSHGRGEPASFPVNRVIAGWTEALQLMKTGSKWELYIPSGLAYGERGAGGVIGPNATLIFEVELLEIQ